MSFSHVRLDLSNLDPVLRALELASNEHDAWLHRLEEGREEPHPFLGMGCSASEVAEVLVTGHTRHWRTAEAMRILGIEAWYVDLRPFEYAEKLSHLVDAMTTYPSESQSGQVIWALRRLKAKNLVAHDPELRYWAVTHDGDEHLRELVA